MKKLLLSTAAVGLALSVAAPAKAEIALDAGGYFMGYAAMVSQDDRSTTSDDRSFDILRNTELHFNGETTLDNGLTVGFHLEMEADGNYNTGENNSMEESYLYMSGGWGRVNIGAEDGAAYLLQVAAPAGDDMVDGIRQQIQPVNYAIAGNAVLPAGSSLDYDQDLTGDGTNIYNDKITYLSPVLNGFQLGVSYTPDTEEVTNSTGGVRADDAEDTMGEAYEIGVRYEGQFNNVGVIAGAGFTEQKLERNTTIAINDATDDRQQWNVGLDLNVGPFGIGAVYMEDDFGDVATAVGTAAGAREEEQTFVVGVDYTTGPFKLGASYLDQDGTNNVVGKVGNDGVETKRYTGGVTYTYGPGMTFRGSVSYVEHDNVNLAVGDEIDATSVLLGTVVKF